LVALPQNEIEPARRNAFLPGIKPQQERLVELALRFTSRYLRQQEEFFASLRVDGPSPVSIPVLLRWRRDSYISRYGMAPLFFSNRGRPIVGGFRFTAVAREGTVAKRCNALHTMVTSAARAN
jgi:hypothetical protein